jgi:hypothetical protein
MVGSYQQSKYLKYLLPLEHYSIDFTYSTQLRRIDFRFTRLDRDPRDALFALSTLSRIESRQLEQVAFRFSDFFLGDIHIASWIKMDRILASPQFATLKDVHICYPLCNASVINLSSFFATLLPACYDRGDLQSSPSFHNSTPKADLPKALESCSHEQGTGIKRR